MYRQAVGREEGRQTAGRTVGELLATARELGEARIEAEAKHKAEEKARREHEAAVARAKYLDGLKGRASTVWDKVESLAAAKSAARYDEAVRLLTDLRDLAEREDPARLKVRVFSFRMAHATQSALIKRLDQAGL